MDIVMFGFNDWHQWSSEEFRTRCGALALRLGACADIDKLLVVSTPRSYFINGLRIARQWAGLSSDSRTAISPYRPHRVGDKVWALDHTRLLPRDEAYEACYQANGAIHDRRLRASIRHACRELGMSNSILWVSDPLMAKHMGRLGERLSVFDAIDDWAVHPQKQSMIGSVRAGYARVRAQADVVFAVSQDLAAQLEGGKGVVSWQPNGVDASRFAEPRECPAQLRDLPRPVVGYVGTIQQRVDPQLIEASASAIPGGSVVLVGPVQTPDRFSHVDRLPNVHFVGACEASDVPAFVQHFDVCIVPHVDDAFTRSMDPLKIYEYLAAGKPVVAAGVARMDEPPGLVVRVGSAPEFAREVVRAVSSAASRCDERVSFALERSWEARLDSMLGEVHRALARAESKAVA